MISIIVCKTKNNVIGVNNTLPWKQKNDMQRFKSITLNKVLLLGRKTFDSFGAKPLPNRLHHVVFTRDESLHDVIVEDITFDYLENFTEFHMETTNNQEFMVIGGQHIYEQFLPNASTLYVTELQTELEGDAFFPAIDLEIWKLSAQEHYNADENNQYDYSFLTYVRK